MGRETAELKPDIVLKNYWRNNDQFADFFNAVLFRGEQVIQPEELLETDTDESIIQEHKKYAESMKASRDNIKIRKRTTAHGVELVMLGMEGQKHIHYAMPMRAMGYDYGAYKKQYAHNAVKYRKGKGLNSDEYLSKMKRTDKFTPVITAVVYYGEKPWDGAKTLHGMLDIPQGMEPYVNDYRMLLIQARKSGLNFRDKRNKDLFHLLEIILDRSMPKKEAKERAARYSEEHKVDKETLMAVAGAANAKIDYNAFEKGEWKMCTLFDEIAEEGRKEGMKKGREEGVKKGREEGMKKGREEGMKKGREEGMKKGREEGMKKGREEGMKKGRKEGMKKGREEGKIEGRAVEIIETGIEFKLQDADILERLQRKLNISLQKAQEYFGMFENSARS